MSARQRITVLGATGSVGESTLDVIGRHPERFEVIALTAHQNVGDLARACARFDARQAVIGDEGRLDELRDALKAENCSAEAMGGPEALVAVAASEDIDTVMAAIVGSAGLAATLAAARAGKRILLANKESLVVAGELFMETARRCGATIIPVDSEHNGLFQALPEGCGVGGFRGGLESVGVERLILTASGGPFLDLPAEALTSVTPEQACAHPNWDMGRKISVDSATLMNKGLEVIEARLLFGARPAQLDVIVHPQSIVHALVEMADGSVLAQLGAPDMRTPIANALAWPERISSGVSRLNLVEAGQLDFREPDQARFPCLGLAYAALETGGNAPLVLNAANEIAVETFLEGRIGFTDIAPLIEATLDAAAGEAPSDLDAVFEQDGHSRAVAQQIAGELNRRYG